jgi:hypothetical protein
LRGLEGELWKLYESEKTHYDDQEGIPDERTDCGAEGIQGTHTGSLTENAYKY